MVARVVVLMMLLLLLLLLLLVVLLLVVEIVVFGVMWGRVGVVGGHGRLEGHAHTVRTGLTVHVRKRRNGWDV
jgi:hypothetical protein